MENKTKPNVILYTIFMLAIFTIITEAIIWGYGSDILIKAIKNHPKGNLVIIEAVLASLVLIVLLLFKNSYVFTQKREKFSKGLFYGLYYLIGATVFTLLYGVLLGGFKSGLAVLNLAVGCFLIGITEEFLCRGWLLNEFLEKFGDTKKGVWYSIIVSGTIFGLLHLGNIYSSGQDIPATIVQVMSAASTGIVFGIIYYKTKNIWSVIALHGIWDFSLLLSEVRPVFFNTEYVPKFSIIGLMFSILLALIELLNVVPYINDINSKPKKSSIILFSCLSIGLFLFVAITNTIVTFNFVKEYKYDSINIKNYSVTRDNYSDYYIKVDDKITNKEEYSFRLSKDNNNDLVLTNLNTKYNVTIKCESLYDYIIMEEEERYILAYIDYTDHSNTFLKYVYINKNEISNDDSFLDNITRITKKYLLTEKSELVVVSDREKNKSYIGAYNSDYGYYLLKSKNKVAILNRD